MSRACPAVHALPQGMCKHSMALNVVRVLLALLSDGDIDQAQETASQVYSSLDRAAQRGAIHPKNAARRKSRIMKAIQDVVSSSRE